VITTPTPLPVPGQSFCQTPSYASPVKIADLSAHLGDTARHRPVIACGGEVPVASHDLGGLIEYDFIRIAKLDVTMARAYPKIALT
jgi:hypothetical protein